MSNSDVETQKKINQGIQKLNEIFSGNLKCPMCGGHEFEVADGFVRNDIQKEITSISLGGHSVPTLPIICLKCGFVSQHAIGVLGLLKMTNNKQE